MKVVYIAGTGRSGSTLLSRLLGEVCGFANLGEATGHLLRRSRREHPLLCGCGSRLDDCAFWRPVVERIDPVAVDLGDRYQPLRAMPGLLRSVDAEVREPALIRYGAALESLLEVAARATGCDVVVDASKVAANALILARVRDVDVYVIHLVRDLDGFIQSRSTDKGYLKRMSPFKAAWVWTGHNRAARSLRGRVPHYCHLSFEAFAESPEETLRHLVRDFLDEARDVSFVRGRMARVGTQHIVAGNPDKFEAGEIEIRSPRPVHLHGRARIASLLARAIRPGHSSAEVGRASAPRVAWTASPAARTND